MNEYICIQKQAIRLPAHPFHFRQVRIVGKSVVMYVHLSACTSMPLTGQIAVEFHTGDFNENC